MALPLTLPFDVSFALRPHSGEAGSLSHLASTFLVAQSINHGIRLKQCPVLQYLYYLEQVGLSVAPLSNNILFTEYDRNPFPDFFARGLNVTLSTDDPLLIHYTKVRPCSVTLHFCENAGNL